MRGNRLARGGDPMKTRRERRVERQRKIAKTNRAQRLRKRLDRLAAKNFTHQEENHMTALMESYILRRKAERKKERQEGEKIDESKENTAKVDNTNGKKPECNRSANNIDNEVRNKGKKRTYSGRKFLTEKSSSHKSNNDFAFHRSLY